MKISRNMESALDKYDKAIAKKLAKLASIKEAMKSVKE